MLIHANTRRYTPIQANTHQYTPTQANTHQYMPIHETQIDETSNIDKIFQIKLEERNSKL